MRINVYTHRGNIPPARVIWFSIVFVPILPYKLVFFGVKSAFLGIFLALQSAKSPIFAPTINASR